VSERAHPNPKPRDDTDVVKDMACELADIAHHISTLKGEANAYLGDPTYDTLRLRLENAHAAVEVAAVEARRRLRLLEGRQQPASTFEATAKIVHMGDVPSTGHLIP
jgi:hypothetical protein